MSCVIIKFNTSIDRYVKSFLNIENHQHDDEDDPKDKLIDL